MVLTTNNYMVNRTRGKPTAFSSWTMLFIYCIFWCKTNTRNLLVEKMQCPTGRYNSQFCQLIFWHLPSKWKLITTTGAVNFTLIANFQERPTCRWLMKCILNFTLENMEKRWIIDEMHPQLNIRKHGKKKRSFQGAFQYYLKFWKKKLFFHFKLCVLLACIYFVLQNCVYFSLCFCNKMLQIVSNSQLNLKITSISSE